MQEVYWARFPFGAFYGLSIAISNGTVAPVNVWTSDFTLLSFQLPNWLPLVAALAAILVVYARAKGAELLLVLPKLLLFYAMLHVVTFGLFAFDRRVSLGLGAFLTLFALLGSWRAITDASRHITDALAQSTSVV